MRGAPRQTAVLIGRFGSTFDAIYAVLRPQLARLRVDGRSIELRRIERSSLRFLTDAIRQTIRDACLVAVVLTPLERSGVLEWNPNVMFELGLAEAWGIPAILFCDVKFKRRVNEIPFDIRTCKVYFYSSEKKGLNKLTRTFLEWFSTANLNVSVGAQIFASDAAAIEAAIRRWPAKDGEPFVGMFRQQQHTMLDAANTITRYFNDDAQTVTFAERPETLDRFLAGVARSLGPGGQYLSFSNPTFLRLVLKQNSLFQQALLESKASVKRLILVGRAEIIDPEVRDTLEIHNKLSEGRPNYRTKCARTEERFGRDDERHIGIFVWPDGRRARFRPVYERRRGNLVLSKVEYSRSADDAMVAFESAWNASDPKDKRTDPHRRRRIRRAA
jgi:hypothetical protein